MPIYVRDLRPHLGLLNWQLRLMGITVVAHVSMPKTENPTFNQKDTDNLEVSSIEVVKTTTWTIICDGCGNTYNISQEPIVRCPVCNTEERGDARVNKTNDDSKDKPPKNPKSGDKKRLTEVVEPKHERLAEYDIPDEAFPR